MSKKKGASASTQQNPHPAKSRAKLSPAIWLIAVAAVVAVGAIYFLTSGSGTASPSAEEAKYIGRLLPAGYEEPSVGDGGSVSADTPMTPTELQVGDADVSFAAAGLASKRNLGLSYKRADGNEIPLIAYVKPSGKLFVGVSYCVPCKGTGQTLTTDGKLTCDSCGTKRDPESGAGISGACKLYPLDEVPAKVEGDRIVVDKAALDSWTEQPIDRPVGG